MKDLIFIITNGLETTTLEHSPDGWDDSVVNIERSLKFYGIFRTFTVKLKFMLDGAALLRGYFYDKNIDDVRLEIQKLDRVTLTYYTVYRGIFDFSTYTQTEHAVEIVLTDRGLSALIKKYLDTEFNIAFLTSNTFDIPRGGSLYSVEFIYYSRLLRLVMDAVTDGGISNGDFAIDDSALTTLESGTFRRVITSHNAMKGFRMMPFNWTLDKTLKALFVQFGLTVSVNLVGNTETLVLQTLDDTFSGSKYQISQNAVTDFRLTIAQDFMFDKLWIGYETQEYPELTEAVREFNGKSIFEIGNILTLNKELDMVCPIRADWQQMNYDMRHPNVYHEVEEPIFVAVFRYIDLTLRIEGGTVSNQSFSPVNVSWFNTMISPKHLVEERKKFIDSVRYGGNPNMRFLSSDYSNAGNKTYVHGIIGDEEDEGAGRAHGNDTYFIPLYVEFEIDIPATFVDDINQNVNKALEFNYNGNTFSGFLISTNIKLHGRSSAKFKLLLSPDCDLSKLK